MTGGMMGTVGAEVIPFPTPFTQAAQSLSDLLAVLADPAKAQAMIDDIKAASEQHEKTRLAAQDALGIAIARHADADRRGKELDEFEADLSEREAQYGLLTDRLSTREQHAARMEASASEAKSRAEAKEAEVSRQLAAREAEVLKRENEATAREKNVDLRERHAEELIAQYNGKLESFRRIAVG